jgi:hypothetical protein
MQPPDPTRCPCREVEPYSDTTDLERRVASTDRFPGHAIFVAVDDWTFRCRQCGALWTGSACPGWIYGDTRWRREPS